MRQNSNKVYLRQSAASFFVLLIVFMALLITYLSGWVLGTNKVLNKDFGLHVRLLADPTKTPVYFEMPLREATVPDLLALENSKRRRLSTGNYPQPDVEKNK